MTEPLLTVLYAGEPMLEVLEDGSHRTVSAGVNQARIKGNLLDVVNKLGTTLVELRQQVKAGSVNPYRTALLDDAAVWKEIPHAHRGAIRKPEMRRVLAAVMAIAKRSEH